MDRFHMSGVVEEKKRVKKGFHKSGISYIRNGKRYKVFITYAQQQQQTMEQLLLLMTIHFDLPEIISHTYRFYGIRIDSIMCVCVFSELPLIPCILFCRFNGNLSERK